MNKKYKWFHIKAFDQRVNRVMRFFLGAKNEDQLAKRLDKLQIKDIEWILEESPVIDK